MSGVLLLRNRQRRWEVDTRHLRRIIRAFLRDELFRDDFELGVFLVNKAAITELNQEYLRHSGSTDVITFDYGDNARPQYVAGEIFVCVPEAVAQAKQFRTTWQSELVRYIVHGVLHLIGFDDRDTANRRRMKGEEDRLVKRLSRSFNIARVGGHRRAVIPILANRERAKTMSRLTNGRERT